MTDTVGERTLSDLLAERVEVYRDHALIEFEDCDRAVSEITYGEFAELVERCAAGLHARGIGKGDHVVVHMRNCPELMVVWFATARLGAVFVPSNVANTASEVEHVIGFTDAVLAITQPDLIEPVEKAIDSLPIDVELMVARGDAGGHSDFEELMSSDGRAPDAEVRSEDVAELIFTSGTTRKPKAVMLSHANCLRAGLDSVNCFWLEEGDRLLTALPLFHVNAQAISALAAMTVGGTLILLEEFRASRFWSQVRSYRATQTAIVAMQLRTMLAQPPDPEDRSHSLRRIFYAINVTDEEKEQFEERFGVALINGYGQSEAMTLLCCSPVVGPRRWPSIGLPSSGRKLTLVDENGEEVPVGEVGEITARGTPGRDFMLGYYKDPEATAAAISDGILRTGDNAYRDEHGYFYFFDRKKDMIKRAGENVSAMEVEAVLLEHPDIDEAAVVGVPDEIRDEKVAALIVVRESCSLTEDEVTEFCSEHLSKFKVPTLVNFTDGLPKTSIGKVKKNEVRKLLSA